MCSDAHGRTHTCLHTTGVHIYVCVWVKDDDTESHTVLIHTGTHRYRNRLIDTGWTHERHKHRGREGGWRPSPLRLKPLEPAALPPTQPPTAPLGPGSPSPVSLFPNTWLYHEHCPGARVQPPRFMHKTSPVLQPSSAASPPQLPTGPQTLRECRVSGVRPHQPHGGAALGSFPGRPQPGTQPSKCWPVPQVTHSNVIMSVPGPMLVSIPRTAMQVD